MSLVVYQYPRCSTCKKALSWLAKHDLSFEAVDIALAPPSARELAALWKASGLPLSALFNTSGESYRSGRFSERRSSMSDDEQLAALAADGMLIKRPLLVVRVAKSPAHVLVGFKEPEYAAALLKKP